MRSILCLTICLVSIAKDGQGITSQKIMDNNFWLLIFDRILYAMSLF